MKQFEEALRCLDLAIDLHSTSYKVCEGMGYQVSILLAAIVCGPLLHVQLDRTGGALRLSSES